MRSLHHIQAHRVNAHEYGRNCRLKHKKQLEKHIHTYTCGLCKHWIGSNWIERVLQLNTVYGAYSKLMVLKSKNTHLAVCVLITHSVHSLVSYALTCLHPPNWIGFVFRFSVNIYLWWFVILNVFTILVTYLHLMCIEWGRTKIKIKVLVANALQCACAYKCVLSSAVCLCQSVRPHSSSLRLFLSHTVSQSLAGIQSAHAPFLISQKLLIQSMHWWQAGLGKWVNYLHSIVYHLHKVDVRYAKNCICWCDAICRFQMWLKTSL